MSENHVAEIEGFLTRNVNVVLATFEFCVNKNKKVRINKESFRIIFGESGESIDDLFQSFKEQITDFTADNYTAKCLFYYEGYDKENNKLIWLCNYSKIEKRLDVPF